MPSDENMTKHAVKCQDCGYFEEVTEGAFSLGVEGRANRKKAGHMSGKGCENTVVEGEKDCGTYHPLPCGLDRDCPDTDTDHGA